MELEEILNDIKKSVDSQPSLSGLVMNVTFDAAKQISDVRDGISREVRDSIIETKKGFQESLFDVYRDISEKKVKTDNELKELINRVKFCVEKIDFNPNINVKSDPEILSELQNIISSLHSLKEKKKFSHEIIRDSNQLIKTIITTQI